MATNDRKSAEEEVVRRLGSTKYGVSMEQAIADAYDDFHVCFDVAVALAERVSVLERALRDLIKWVDANCDKHQGDNLTCPACIAIDKAEAALGETERNTL